MQNLAVYAYSEYKDPGVDVQASYDKAWAAALTLIADRDDPQPARPLDLPPLRHRDPLAEIETANAQGQEEDARDSRQDQTSSGAPPSADRPREDAPSGRGSAAPIGSSAWRSASRSSDVNLYYGDFHAVKDVDDDDRAEPGDGADRLLGLRQDDLPALAQPHARADPRRPGRGRGHPRRPGHLRAGRRPGRGPPPGRDGLPGAEPVPDDVGLRERRRRPHPQPQGHLEVREGRGRRALAARRPPLGRGQGPARQARAPASPAASSSGSASPARSRSSRRSC